MQRRILLIVAAAVAASACGSDGKATSVTAAPGGSAAAAATTVAATPAPVETTEAPPTVAVTAAASTTTTPATTAPATAAPSTTTTYPPGSDRNDANVDAAEAEAIRNDLRSLNYTVVPDMFTDERLQAIASESCSRTSQYTSLPEFFVGEFPAVLNALGMLGSGTSKTVEADTNWEIRALVDATGAACGTEVGRILSGA